MEQTQETWKNIKLDMGRTTSVITIGYQRLHNWTVVSELKWWGCKLWDRKRKEYAYSSIRILHRAHPDFLPYNLLIGTWPDRKVIVDHVGVNLILGHVLRSRCSFNASIAENDDDPIVLLRLEGNNRIRRFRYWTRQVLPKFNVTLKRGRALHLIFQLGDASLNDADSNSSWEIN